MASGQDLRITDVPFSNLPATTATVFINDNGKLRQTDLTTVAKNSELHTLIVGAHQTALTELQAQYDNNYQDWERIHDHTLDAFQRASDQHVQTLDDKLNASSEELTQLIDEGHEKLQDDIKVVDELCAYAATVRETTFEKNAQLMPTVPGNVIIGSIKGDSYQKQETRISKNLAKVNEFTADNTVYTLNLSEGLKLNTLYHIQADVEVQVGELNGIHVSFGDASTTFPIVDGRISAIWDTSILSSTRDYLIFFPNDIPVGSGGKTVKFSNVMLTESDTEVAYESYFEPQVSPSPAFPQEIESVGDNGWFDGNLAQGSFNTGAETASTTRLRTGYIPVTVGDVIEITVKNALAYELFFYNENKEYSMSQAMNASVYSYTVTTGSYMRFSIRYEDNSTITPNDDISVSVTINGKYATRIKTVGKNLYNPNSDVYNIYANNENNVIEKSNSALAYLIKAKPNTTYLFGRNGGTKYARIGFLDKLPVVGEKALSVEYMANEALCSVTSPQNTKYILWYHSNETSIATDVFCYETTELSDTYEPYTSNTITIPLTEPLRAIGEVKDEICVQDGKYGVLRRIGKHVVTADTSVQTHKALVNGGYSHFIEIPDKKIGHDTTIFEHFTNAENNLYDSNAIGTYTDHHTLPRLYVVTTFAETIDFKNWLIANASVIMYELATPVFEPFADQTPFYELMAYDEVTNISIVCGDNLNPSATVMYPSTPSGALLTNAYVAGKVVKPSADVIVNLLDTAWELDEVTGMYTQTIAVKGVTHNDTPVIGLLASDTPTSDAEVEAYAHLTDAVTGDGTLTLYADEALSIAINIVVKGINSGAEATVTIADIAAMTTQYNEMKAKVAELNNALGYFKNLTITTNGGFSTMSDDIANQWSSIPNSNGVVKVVNGATLYHGTYNKYSNTVGSIHMTDIGNSGASYVWYINESTHALKEICTK